LGLFQIILTLKSGYICVHKRYQIYFYVYGSTAACYNATAACYSATAACYCATAACYSATAACYSATAACYRATAACYRATAACYMMEEMRIRLTQPQVELELGLSLAKSIQFKKIETYSLFFRNLYFWTILGRRFRGNQIWIYH
jgi:hypothetical protein